MDFGRVGFDHAFPNQREYIDVPGRMDQDKVVPSKLTPEIELIARASYRLGHAENGYALAANDAHSVGRENERLKSELENSKGNVQYYSNRCDAYAKQLSAAHEEIEKLKKKLEPKKKPAKKTPAKKASKK